ncbi:MAG TPA: allantoinase AllB [Beutenbergiaceae bacterium]|nr:allantoinase AllB [Beutenbergiaceae bacterium]
MKYDVVLRSQRVLTPAGFQPREVGIKDGKIAAVEPLGNALAGEQVYELQPEEVLLPGLVDTHVHINEPGRTQWEGFESATRAAAKGGVTTVIDMPLNSIPATTDRAALEEKVAATHGKRHVHVGFWGGAVPGNKPHLRELHDAGVFGFKTFLLHSGVEEFQPLTPDELEDYLTELVDFDATMIVHAEDSRSIDRAPHAEGSDYHRFLTSRPRSAENLAVAEVIARARWTGAKAHILHLSSSDALPMIASAKRDGVRITAETCPHYLTLTAEEIPDGNTAYKCCPPIREASNQDKLWEGLVDGTIDCIVTDHSPSTVDLKHLDTGDFGTAWGGIASLQVSLAVVWSAARARGIGLDKVVEWMATNPARLAGLRSKGTIGVGFDADMSIFAPDEAFVVQADQLEHKNPITPYHERALSGVVRRVFLTGSEIDFANPAGQLLWRGQA